MPSGKVHEAFNLLCLPAVFYAPDPVEKLPFVTGYLLGTFLLSPDLDLETSRPARRWWVLRWLWVPYARLAGHRRISHFPLLGLLVRLTYVLGLVGLAVFIASKAGVPLPVVKWSAISWKMFSVGLGLLAADLLHILLDGIVTLFKRLRH